MKSLLKKIGSYQIVQKIAGFILGCYFLFVFKTCRWKTVGLDNYHKDFPAVFVFWHAEIALIPLLTKMAKMNMPLWAIVSMHRDGRIASNFLKFLKVTSIDGSTNHGGVDAAIKAIRLIRGGKDIVGVCPDGPRGPANKLSKGAFFIAKKAKVPVYALTYAVRGHKLMRTWDRFMIPFPFSYGVMKMSEPFYVRNDIPEDEQCLALEKLMNDNSADARAMARGDL